MSEPVKKQPLQLINVGPEIIPLDELCNVEKVVETETLYRTRRNWFGWPVREECGSETEYSLLFGYTNQGIYPKGFSVEYPSQEAMDAAYETVLAALRARGQMEWEEGRRG